MDWSQFQNILGDCEISGDKIIIKSNPAAALEFVKNNYKFDILKEIIAVDNKDAGIELIYNLYSTVNEESLKLSITVKDSVETVSVVFDSAIADEKEIYDLFGVKFIGNNELKRLYMPEDWEGHPLRKEGE